MIVENADLARVGRIFGEQLGLEVPTPETDLIETGLLDSLALVELLLGLEEEFGVEVPLAELEIESFRSVRSIAAYVGSLAATP